jgi:hypothetical protein
MDFNWIWGILPKIKKFFVGTPNNSLRTLVDNQICVFCGSKLSSGKLSKCLNVRCNSHDFAVGNRVILLNQLDYGTGFIEKISDYKMFDFEYTMTE